MNYQRMIDILETVQADYENENNYSPYVCDNVGDAANDEIDSPSPEQEQIRADIAKYINGEWSMQNWMSIRDARDYRRDDLAVMEERIKMIDYLIATYRNKLGEQS